MKTRQSRRNDLGLPRRSACAARVSIALLTAALGLSASPMWAQAPAPKGGDSSTAAATTQPAVLELMVGRSAVVPAPASWKVTRAYTTDPKIASIAPTDTPTFVLVQGKAPGSTDVFVWDEHDHVLQFRVEVKIDRTAIKEQIVKLFPGSNIEISQSGETIVLSGMLARAEQAEQLHAYLGTLGLKYVDMTTVAGLQQVQIKVVVAEASRTAIRALGINAVSAGSSAFGGATIGPDNSGPLNPINIAPSGNTGQTVFTTSANVAPAVTLFGGVPSADLQVFVQALNENQYMRILAQPSLVALSGQEASFLAGGEFPIPVLQTVGVATSSSITIEYKEFGVRLKFRPTVLGDGAIRLHLAPEVSELSNGPGSVQIQGFSIPAILTRRAETTLELSSGQTFAMAGLVNQSVEARNSKTPGLGDVPVLGALFRSVRYQQGDTELVVLVTASLVEPQANSVTALPGILHIRPNDWELFAQGELQGKVPPKVAPIDAAYLQDAGLTRLRGPGAWVTYDSPAPPSQASLNQGVPAATAPAPKSGN